MLVVASYISEYGDRLVVCLNEKIIQAKAAIFLKLKSCFLGQKMFYDIFPAKLGGKRKV